MFLSIVWALVGLGLLLLGAEWLVRGSSRLARHLGVSGLVTGLTVVAIGTSAPELATSMIGAFQGRGDIALGNAVGSNIVNIGLVLGLTALLMPIRVAETMNGRLIPFLLIVSAIALVFSRTGFVISRGEGLVLIVLFAAYMWYTIISARRRSASVVESSEPDRLEGAGAILKNVALVVVGLAFLGVGADLFVRGASDFARLAGLSEAVIGVTVIAVGTSLPELTASVVAARNRMTNMAVGNILGSNVFNTLLIIGAPGALFPFSVSAPLVNTSIPVMLGFTVLLMIFAFTDRTVSRREGIFLALVTASYIGALIRFS